MSKELTTYFLDVYGDFYFKLSCILQKCDLGEPESFLSECLDPPRPQVIARAMSLLYEIGACKGVASLTPLGHHLAALPVHARIGKMLLFGAIFGYLEPVVSQEPFFKYM